MSLKKTLIINAIILSISVLMFTFATVAYFTDDKGMQTIITSGNVTIALSEAAVKSDGRGNLVADPDSPRIFGSADLTPHDYGVVYPGQTIYKDPTILNVGEQPAYIAAKISISDGRGDIHRVFGFPNYDEIAYDSFLAGGLLSETAMFGPWNGIQDVTYTEEFAIVQVPNRAAGIYDFYIFILQPMQHGQSVVLFDQMFFSDEFSNTEMAEFIDLKMDIWAFGVQTAGFTSCLEAMTSALPDHFASVSQLNP